MEKIDFENVSLKCVAEKINEIVDTLNGIQEERIAELEKRINLIKYGKYMTDEDVMYDMKRQCELTMLSGNTN